MHRFLILAGVVAATPVAAQPVMHPDCAVTIVRAPDDVRAVVERWVHAEPRCGGTLEVRIIPTNGGLYLLARDQLGRVRERIVPDAQSAGVLIASWAADDSIVSPAAAAPLPEPTMERGGLAPTLEKNPNVVWTSPPAGPTSPPAGPISPPAGPISPPAGPISPPAGPPVTSPISGPTNLVDSPIGAPGLTKAMTPPASSSPRWLSFGGIVGSSGGVRAELDLFTHHAWSIGVGASYSAENIDISETVSEPGIMQLTDTKAVVYLAHTSDFGRWHLRASVGVGAVLTHLMSETYNSVNQGTMQSAAQLFPTAEGSLMLSRDLGDHWGLEVGPVLTVLDQSIVLDDYGGFVQRDVDLTVFAGARYRL